MPDNNHTQDLYNPPGTNTNDWDTIRFSEIDVSDLFWFSQSPNGEVNNCHRKLDESSAQNTKSREIITVSNTTTVYQKI